MDDSHTGAPQSRMTELDWLRIGAFGLLIFYHVGMYYVSWDWHVKSPRLVPGLEAWMRWLNPWRMPLLFVVSGAATALLARPGQPLAGPRTRRLLVPLLFGMAVVVPPQPWLEVAAKFGYEGSYLEFLGLYFQAYAGFCKAGKCLDLPTWNHLWFLVYLWVYTLLLAAVLRARGFSWATAPSWRSFTAGGRLLWMPWLLFALARQWLFPHFPATNDLVHDAYNHALYGLMFLIGFVFLGDRRDRHGAWAAAVRLRWWALGTSVLAMLVFQTVVAAYPGDEQPSGTAIAALRALNAWRQWAPIVALLGFARLHLAGRDGPARRWFTEGVFPFYIVHQTVIVLLAVQLSRAGLPLWLEGALLVVGTAAACVATFEVARRVRWLRAVFGLKTSGP